VTKYRKLVRDRIPEILDGKGVPYEQTIADDAEYRAELIRKLAEEAAELAEAGAVEELADVIEVVEALKALPEYAAVEAERQKKLEERGGFARRIILAGEK
jgi:predicted house-cleaning noncanonical NTP pyrophosphatase (MazG superfamily)